MERIGRILLEEGITRTLAGTRIWDKKTVPFVLHLKGVMKSICSGMAENLAAEKMRSRCPSPNRSGATTNPALNPNQLAVSPMPTAEEATENQDAVNAIKEYFRDDPIVLEIISAIEEGFTDDIKEVLGISQTELETRMRRLRRGATKVLS